MRIIAISDTHEKHAKVKVPEGDVLICAGDFTYQGHIHAVKDFAEWMGRQPHAHKIVIAGNHELTFQSPQAKLYRHALTDHGLVYLQDSSVVIDGLTFYGSPWQPWFHDWAFNLQRGKDIAAKWADIPEDTNVLITHGPPRGFLDRTLRAGPQGCTDLYMRIRQLKNLKLHIFGHLHLDGGDMVEDEEIIFANAAICDESYNPCRAPLIIDL